MALWLLRQIRNAEDEEMQRHSDQLDCFDLKITDTIPLEYDAIEEAYLSCEHALDSLNSAIEDLEYVLLTRYGGATGRQPERRSVVSK